MKIIGYRLRWIADYTCWYADPEASHVSTGGKLFASKGAARKCLVTLNNGWQQNAKIVRVVRWRKGERKDKP